MKLPTPPFLASDLLENWYSMHLSGVSFDSWSKNFNEAL
jgi:hypothetical protein